MKYLVINSGSSSLKFQLIEMPSERVLYKGEFVHHSQNQYLYKSEKEEIDITKKDFEYSIDYIFDKLADEELVTSDRDLDAVVHRVVHGGEHFDAPRELTEDVIEKIESLSAFAPLHNPPALEKIRYIKENMPDVKQYGVFDTSFHLTNSKENYLYGLPYGYYENLGVRKFGFHGLSYSYVSSELSSYSKMIICHLGSGSSVCAVKNGKSINNSFGFSPNENLIMATRSGEVDYDAIVFLKSKLGLTESEVSEMLNKESGLLGISGISQSMEELLDVMDSNERAKLAVNKFVSEVVHYIAEYYVELEGVDALVFTGGIGFNSAPIRKMVSEKLSVIGINLNGEKNKSVDLNNSLPQILSDDAPAVITLKTNEELNMARAVANLS